MLQSSGVRRQCVKVKFLDRRFPLTNRMADRLSPFLGRRPKAAVFGPFSLFRPLPKFLSIHTSLSGGPRSIRLGRLGFVRGPERRLVCTKPVVHEGDVNASFRAIREPRSVILEVSLELLPNRLAVGLVVAPSHVGPAAPLQARGGVARERAC